MQRRDFFYFIFARVCQIARFVVVGLRDREQELIIVPRQAEEHPSSFHSFNPSAPLSPLVAAFNPHLLPLHPFFPILASFLTNTRSRIASFVTFFDAPDSCTRYPWAQHTRLDMSIHPSSGPLC